MLWGKMLSKVSLNSMILTCFQKDRREGAWCLVAGSAFHSIKATTEKAPFWVGVFKAFLRVATYKCDIM